MVREIQCRANAILFETQQSTDALGNERVRIIRPSPAKAETSSCASSSPLQPWFDKTWTPNELELVQ